MTHPFKVGDIIVKWSPDDLYPGPAKILGLGANNGYIIDAAEINRYGYGWAAHTMPENFLSKEDLNLFKEKHPETKCWWVDFFAISCVESQNKCVESQHETLITGELTLYDLMKKELKERIKKEELQRPINSAFKFL